MEVLHRHSNVPHLTCDSGLQGFANIILSGGTKERACSISCWLAQSKPVPSWANTESNTGSGFTLTATNENIITDKKPVKVSKSKINKATWPVRT